jgi:hypothetical protein
MQLALEPFPTLANTAADQVRERFALNRKKAFKPGYRVVASNQGARLRLQPREWQRILLTRVDHNHGLCAGQVAYGPQRRKLESIIHAGLFARVRDDETGNKSSPSCLFYL